MPSQLSDQVLGDAILESVEHGTFPQSEEVASAPVPAAALPKLLEVVGKAREDTKNEIRSLSREAASDIDGWIAQARRLQSDIKRSQETAHEIVKQAEQGKALDAKVEDAASKVSFLYSEIAYNESLVQVVQQLQDISTLLESASDAAVHGNVMHALERLEDADIAFTRLGPFGNTRVVGVLRTKQKQLRDAIEENTKEQWNALIIVDPNERKITLKDEEQSQAAIKIDSVVEALTKLGLLDGIITKLSHSFDKIILSARLTPTSDKIVSSIEIEGDDIQINGHLVDMTVRATLEDIQAIAEYLSTRLPPSIAIPMSAKLVPILSSRLINGWLLPAVPLSMDAVEDFQETLSLVLGLAEYFDELEWSGQERLRDWVDKSAEIWLAKRKEYGIVRVRFLCSKRVHEKKTVERVETQVVSKGDAVLGHEEQEEDWGDAWGEDEEDKTEENQATPKEDIEDEDMSAWGIDEEDSNEPAKDVSDASTKEQDDEHAEDWGEDWGEDEDAKPAPVQSTPKMHANGKAQTPKPPAEKEVTLRETYTVTAIPDSIMEIIMQVVSDVGTLNTPELVKSVIAPASGGLYAIPTLLLAMYRATAATHYSKDVAGNMLIYNDCTRLSDRLRTFLQEQAEADKSSTLPHLLRPSVRLNLDEAIKSVEAFGKRAYGREMESQRTIIRDLLDGAQGFQSCTTAPFASECDNAIAMTIDRITEVKRQWQNILSHSALLQSLGSLVSTALTKFITDVEDMSDIAEDESKKLHSYCVSLSSLNTLFTTKTDDGKGEQRDMTTIYTPNWFKFQYLGEILDSSLADIRYFWLEGELKLEMGVEEVVDLILALFAESEYRRKAVADIRRGSK